MDGSHRPGFVRRLSSYYDVIEAAARNNAPARVDFRLRNDVGTRDPKVSRLNGWPLRTPPDASPTPSRVPTYGLGPMWFATPSS